MTCWKRSVNVLFRIDFISTLLTHPYVQVHNISKIIRTITIRLDDVNRNKMGSEQAVALFRAMAKEQRLKDRGGGGDNRSVDSLSLDMDKHVHDIVQEMRHMKSEHDRHLKGLKDYLEQAIEFAANKTMTDGEFIDDLYRLLTAIV